MKKVCVPAVVLLMVLGLGLGSAFSQEPREIDIKISPNVINLNSRGTWVTVHADVPLAGVATATVYLDDVQVAWTKADAQGNLVAKFHLSVVKGIVAPPRATLTMVGQVTDPDGVVLFTFIGSDTITVRAGKS